MPGVPSGRGCNACRKQKKKCDITQYPCPRCKRLNVPCEGLGERRYRFKDENEKLAVGTDVKSRRASEEALVSIPSRNLSSPITRLTAALIEKIGSSVDVRFHLQENFGPYFADIPCRLGASEALDSATDLVVTAHVRFCTGNSSPHAVLLAKYSNTLSKLRHDLNDPIKAQSSETLCAIMLLMIYQSLTKSIQPSSVTHTDGATQVLKGRGYVGPRNDFERLLLATLRGPVVVEALMKDEVAFTPQEWSDLVTVDVNNACAVRNPIKSLARIPHLLQRCRNVVPCLAVPDQRVMDLKRDIEHLRQDCSTLIAELRAWVKTIKTNPTINQTEALIHARALSLYAMGLATGIITNCMLGGLEDDCIWLSSESSYYSNEIYQSAVLAMKYLPLGALAMLIFLRSAYLGALEVDKKDQIESLQFDYEVACWGSPLSNFEKDQDALTTRFAFKSFKEYTLMQERHRSLLGIKSGFTQQRHSPEAVIEQVL